jgi:hypothetical protein
VKAFLAEQRAFQERLGATLRLDPDQLERNSLLIWTWDYLSLALCLDWNPATARGCPTTNGQVDVELAIHDGVARLDPWPFAGDAVTVRAEGRRLERRYANAEAMQRAFAAARWETLELRLEAG